MSVTLAHVQAAARRIASYIQRTPLVRADGLSRATGRDVFLKLETLQRTRAFKRRGACNALLALAEREGTVPPLVTASAGNHGAAMASVATELGASLTIYVPSSAPRAKLDRLRGAGITIVADCPDYDDAEGRAIAASRRGEGVFVSPYSHPDVIAGAGTIGLEVLEDLPSCGAIVVPTGGGGLLSGVAIACDGRTAVVGVEPAVNPAFTDALAAGHTTTIAPGASIADGLLGNLEPNSLTFDLVRDAAVPILLAREPAIIGAMHALFSQERLVAEGAGGIGVAALLDGQLDRWPDPLVLLVTGANVDADTFSGAIGGPPFTPATPATP
ncbi:MAG TPA: threonine/serine dehydratase [Luteitalea sp.]|nr:threonine/serine dehydratase [Luteitalea sp.]